METPRAFPDDCFSAPDHEFAAMPAEIDATLDWVKQLRHDQVGWKQANAQVVSFLESRGVGKGSIKRQLERAKALVRPWLI